MRHYKSFHLLFLAIFLFSSQAGYSATKKSGSTAASYVASKVLSIIAVSIPDMALPVLPATKGEHHSKKTHTPKLEEVAHIHHFHKERVKKLKRHHKKYWAFSKLILVFIHIALLIMAYMHMTH